MDMVIILQALIDDQQVNLLRVHLDQLIQCDRMIRRAPQVKGGVGQFARLERGIGADRGQSPRVARYPSRKERA